MNKNYLLKTQLKKGLSKKTSCHALPWYQLSLLIILIDQWTKHIATYRLTPYEPYPITPFFNLMLAYNQGAAFSLLSHQPLLAFWLFTSIALVISMAITLGLYYMPPDRSWVYPCALALVLGGALGNVIDRFLYRFVIDFLQFYYQNWYFPTFNIADCAISIGAGMLLLDALICKKSNE